MKQELPHQHAQMQARLPHTGPKDFQSLAEQFKLLSDPTRLEIFWTLCHAEVCVTNLAAIVNTSPPALSHHLKLLKAGDLITSRRVGKEVYYTAAKTQQVHTLHRAVEQLMDISCPQRQRELCRDQACARQQLSGQEQVFHDIHMYLLEHLEERITIEELARMFLMNTTTLKDGFKAMYGTSIAAHMKEHRLEKAAQLLLQGDLSVAEIARRVGYTSQSKFSAAFSAAYHSSPLDYRKRHRP